MDLVRARYQGVDTLKQQGYRDQEFWVDLQSNVKLGCIYPGIVKHPNNTFRATQFLVVWSGIRALKGGSMTGGSRSDFIDPPMF